MGGKRRRWLASGAAALFGAVGLAVIAGSAWLGALLLIAALTFLAWGALPIYTSGGFRWRTGNEGEIPIPQADKAQYGAGVDVIPASSLPQPLALRVKCSVAPTDVVYQFHNDLETRKRRRSAGSIRRRGKIVHLVLQEPQLSAPAVLRVFVKADEPIHVDEIKRRDSG